MYKIFQTQPTIQIYVCEAANKVGTVCGARTHVLGVDSPSVSVGNAQRLLSASYYRACRHSLGSERNGCLQFFMTSFVAVLQSVLCVLLMPHQKLPIFLGQCIPFEGVEPKLFPSNLFELSVDQTITSVFELFDGQNNDLLVLRLCSAAKSASMFSSQI